MRFDYGETFTRLRAAAVLDPYSGEPVGEDWGNPEEEPIAGAYFSSQASSDGDGEVRRQTETGQVLVIPDPDADVRRGDRIRRGSRVWRVVGFPEADVNPWTGWQPTLLVELEHHEG